MNLGSSLNAVALAIAFALGMAGTAPAQDIGRLDWRLTISDRTRASAYAFTEQADGMRQVFIAGRLAQARPVPAASGTYTGTLLVFEVDCEGRRLKLREATYYDTGYARVGSGEGTDWIPFADGDQGLAIGAARTACPGERPTPVARSDADFAEAQRWLDQRMAASR